ncbi:hypothetical protein ACFX1Q_027328 [Malus domestica]
MASNAANALFIPCSVFALLLKSKSDPPIQMISAMVFAVDSERLRLMRSERKGMVTNKQEDDSPTERRMAKQREREKERLLIKLVVRSFRSGQRLLT